MEKAKISNSQFSILVIFYSIGSSILLIPSIIASSAKQDSWLASILGVCLGLLMVYLYQLLGSYHPNLNLVELSEKLLGKWLGKGVAFLFFVHFFIIASMVLRNMGDFITTQIMPQTPIQVIHILFLSIVLMGVRLGIETISRASEILIPWVILLFILLILLIAPQMKMENILPLYEKGMKPILEGAMNLLVFPFLELVIFLMVIPCVNQPNKVKMAFLRGAFLGGIILILISSVSTLVLGPEITARQFYPSYSLAKKINIANFLERVEAIVAGIWFLTIFFKLILLFYASNKILAQLFNLSDDRSLSFPVAMILVVLSIIVFPNIAYLIEFTPVWNTYCLVYGVLIPILFLGLSVIRGQKKMDQT